MSVNCSAPGSVLTDINERFWDWSKTIDLFNYSHFDKWKKVRRATDINSYLCVNIFVRTLVTVPSAVLVYLLQKVPFDSESVKCTEKQDDETVALSVSSEKEDEKEDEEEDEEEKEEDRYSGSSAATENGIRYNRDSFGNYNDNSCFYDSEAITDPVFHTPQKKPTDGKESKDSATNSHYYSSEKKLEMKIMKNITVSGVLAVASLALLAVGVIGVASLFTGGIGGILCLAAILHALPAMPAMSLAGKATIFGVSTFFGALGTVGEGCGVVGNYQLLQKFPSHSATSKAIKNS